MAGAVEVALVYGGALTLEANGDLVLSQDVPGGTPQATYERVLRIILTNPTLYDANGNPIGRPDDLFHPTFGSGARAAIGEPNVPAVVSSIAANIIAALKSDPYIASTPAPMVSITQLSANMVQLIVSLTSVTGQPFTLPAFIVSPTGLVTGA